MYYYNTKDPCRIIIADLNYTMYYYNEIKEMNEITGIFKLHNVLLQSKSPASNNFLCSI